MLLKLNLKNVEISAAEEALNSQEFTQQDEFSALAKLLDDFSEIQHT